VSTSSPAPVYTVAGEPPLPTITDAPPARFAAPYDGRIGHTVPGGPTPPRFAKIDFATYDGTEDPLNWLNQCEQFFRGQRTLASDRTWLASYHLRGNAQTWYYSLEQDEGGMPSWERFRELCLLRFGPPVRGSRLAELGRLPFLTTVQDYADRFQALACHAPGVTGQQRADLFVGGLPDNIRVDVELQAPTDLQTAIHYARAYERRAHAMQPPQPSRGGRQTTRPQPPAPAPGRPAPAATASPAPTRTFRRLTPAEQLERRRLGLCFNCDEPFTPGHVCPRLFYLETALDGEMDDPAAEPGAVPPPAPSEHATVTGPAAAFVVSLHALAGIRHERTMLLPVTIRGEMGRCITARKTLIGSIYWWRTILAPRYYYEQQRGKSRRATIKSVTVAQSREHHVASMWARQLDRSARRVCTDTAIMVAWKIGNATGTRQGVALEIAKPPTRP
jgi:hypothetical protein